MKTVFRNGQYTDEFINYELFSFRSTLHEWTFDEESYPFYLSWSGYESYNIGTFRERKNFNFYEIIFTKEGKGRLLYNNTWYDCVPGTVVIIDTSLFHRYEVEGDLWRFKYIQINGVGTKKYIENICREKCFFNIVDTISFDRIMDEILSLTPEKGSDIDMKLSVLICNFLYKIYSAVACSINSPEPVLYRRKICHAINYIETNYDKKLSASELSELVGFSEASFYRFFKQYTGTSPHQYQKYVKISRAKFFLQTTELTMDEISKKIGYVRIQNFDREFKKATGLTPFNYRKKFGIEIY